MLLDTSLVAIELAKPGYHMRVDNVAGNGPLRYCSPCHRLPVNSSSQGTKRVTLNWRETGLADIARHVAGCRVTQDMWDEDESERRITMDRLATRGG